MPLGLTGLTPLIAVYDMPEAIRFWCGTLGFELVSSSPEIDGAKDAISTGPCSARTAPS